MRRYHLPRDCVHIHFFSTNHPEKKEKKDKNKTTIECFSEGHVQSLPETTYFWFFPSSVFKTLHLLFFARKKLITDPTEKSEFPPTPKTCGDMILLFGVHSKCSTLVVVLAGKCKGFCTVPIIWGEVRTRIGATKKILKKTLDGTSWNYTVRCCPMSIVHPKKKLQNGSSVLLFF